MADPADFMRQHHLRELLRGGVQNPDGSVSTYRGMTATDESGRQRMLPTIWDGQALSPPNAYARAQANGLWRYPGSFSPTRALHNYMSDPSQHPAMEEDLASYLQRNALDK
jgi:hypothetical protein